MSITPIFILNSILLGVGLAMDAFSVSLANGLGEPLMPVRKSMRIAGVFGIFQLMMPLIGWICIHTIAKHFEAFQKMIPWIALILLVFLGTKMIREGLLYQNNEENDTTLGGATLIAQGIATSIDALSVGFTIADDPFPLAFLSSVLIGLVTFFICLFGIFLGKRIGTRLSGKASIFGGIILILIGLEIFFS